MGKNSAEYMRAYRARKKAEAEEPLRAAVALGDGMVEHAERPLRARIAELEEEVRHLKGELAARTPLSTDASRRASQAQRDAILRKVNKGA